MTNSSSWKPWPIEIDGLPIKNDRSFHGYISHNQMVTCFSVKDADAAEMIQKWWLMWRVQAAKAAPQHLSYLTWDGLLKPPFETYWTIAIGVFFTSTTTSNVFGIFGLKKLSVPSGLRPHSQPDTFKRLVAAEGGIPQQSSRLQRLSHQGTVGWFMGGTVWLWLTVRHGKWPIYRGLPIKNGDFPWLC